jgi:hypothetical protein
MSEWKHGEIEIKLEDNLIFIQQNKADYRIVMFSADELPRLISLLQAKLNERVVYGGSRNCGKSLKTMINEWRTEEMVDEKMSDDGWIKHDGNKMPDVLRGLKAKDYEVKFQSGNITNWQKPDFWNWSGDANGVKYYRILKPQDKITMTEDDFKKFVNEDYEAVDKWGSRHKWNTQGTCYNYDWASKNLTLIHQGIPNLKWLQEFTREAERNPEPWKAFEVRVKEDGPWVDVVEESHLSILNSKFLEFRRKPQKQKVWQALHKTSDGKFYIKEFNYDNPIPAEDSFVTCLGYYEF